MERRQIEFFVALAEHGSFTAAAAALYVSQPSLSQAIRTLESDLGTELVRRLPRGAELTSAGRAFEVVARQILRDFGNARAAVDAVTDLLGGELDIATLPALTLEPLAKVIGDFRRRHDRVRIRLYQPERVADVIDMVRSGEAELGLVDVPPPSRFDSELDATLLVEQELLMAFPPDTALPSNPLPRSLAFDYPLITGRRGTFVRDLLQEYAKDNAEPTIAIQLERRESAVHLVLAGGGAAVLPNVLASIARDYGAVVVSLDPPLRREIWLVVRSGALSPAAASFVELLLTAPQGGMTTSA